MSTKWLPHHDHPSKVLEKLPNGVCHICSYDTREGCSFCYVCTKCDRQFHNVCIESFINHPIQCSHFFKLEYGYEGPNEGAICHFCPTTITYFPAWCKICKIHMCGNCVDCPPERSIFQPKHHEHSLTLLKRRVTFTCNACGVEEASVPYVCLECDMMVHKVCFDLPRVIMINRHDHRISYTFHLGQGRKEDQDWECGVCRKTIDGNYGAFKCSRCPTYAIHSKCATREEVWDGVELEDVPEQEETVEDPFKVINEKGDIIHFSHLNHILLRLDEHCVMDIRCEGCVLPINGNPCYKCGECGFVLHKGCASLPREKRHLLHNHKLILEVDNKDYFECKACETISNGFRYFCPERHCRDNCVYDVRCTSESEPFHYDLHPQHPLFWTLEGSKECKACGKETKNPLRCAVSDCDYALCMRCATLPRKVKSRYDDHYLRLSQGAGNASGDM